MFNEKIARFIINKRFMLIAILLIITIFFALQIGKVQIATRLDDLLPQKHPFVQFHNEVRDIFGGSNVMFIMVSVKEGDIFNLKTLQKIKIISDEAMFLPGADRYKVFSIAQKKVKDFRATDWGLETKPIMWPRIPQTKEEMDYLKVSIYSNDTVYGSMVSLDSQGALISIQFREDVELDYPGIFKEVNKLCEAATDENTRVSMAGSTMVRAYVYDYLNETNIIFGITALAMVILLLVYTRSFQMVAMPMLSTIISAVWGLGFIGLMGFNLDPLVLVVPLLITARTLSHSVQFNERFIEEYRKVGSIQKAVHTSVKALFLAGLAGILTDAAGIAVLIAIPIPILQKLGMISAFWALTTIFSVLLLNPLVLLFLPPMVKATNKKKAGIFEKLLTKIAVLTKTKNAWMVLIIVFIIAALGIFYAKELKVGDARPGTPLLWPDSRYNLDATAINKRFPGLDPMLLVLSGEKENVAHYYQPLHKIESFQKYMERLPTVGGTLSVVDMVKKINMKLHEDHPKWGNVPYTRREIGLLFHMYTNSTDPGDMDAFITYDNKACSITTYFKDHQGDTVREGINAARAFIDANPTDDVQFKMAGGVIGVTAAVNDEIFKSQILLLVLTFGLTIIFCAIAFRSLFAGILLVIPLAISNYLIFAYMGLQDIGLNTNTLPVATIAVGIGVDYGIYFLSRLKEEYPISNDLHTALSTTLLTTGKAITFTALTVALGVVFWAFSSIRFQAEMGVLLTLVTFFHLLGNLILLSALVAVFKPKFIVSRT